MSMKSGNTLFGNNICIRYKTYFLCYTILDLILWKPFWFFLWWTICHAVFLFSESTSLLVDSCFVSVVGQKRSIPVHIRTHRIVITSQFAIITTSSRFHPLKWLTNGNCFPFWCKANLLIISTLHQKHLENVLLFCGGRIISCCLCSLPSNMKPHCGISSPSNGP